MNAQQQYYDLRSKGIEAAAASERLRLPSMVGEAFEYMWKRARRDRSRDKPRDRRKTHNTTCHAKHGSPLALAGAKDVAEKADADHVARCLKAGGFPRAACVNGRTVWVRPA